MLNKTEKISITGSSMIGGQVAMSFNCELDSVNPATVRPNSHIVNESLYEENLEQCRDDRNAFEDACYKRRDELKAELAETSTGA